MTYSQPKHVHATDAFPHCFLLGLDLCSVVAVKEKCYLKFIAASEFPPASGFGVGIAEELPYSVSLLGDLTIVHRFPQI